MLGTVHTLGLTAALISCAFWIVAAGVRFRPLSLFTLRGPDSIPAALERQCLLNACAAIFAAAAAAAQAFVFYVQNSG